MSSSMIVGFTGTARGMTQRQNDALYQLFVWYDAISLDLMLRHGDCIGADKQAHDIFTIMLGKSTDNVFIHPGFNPARPNDESKSAFCEGRLVTTVLPYLRRDRYIAGCVAGFNTDLLIAAPNTDYEVLRSGTWSTVRYARAATTPRIILLP